MKWIAAAIAVVAILALTLSTDARTRHHKETHYRGWQAPDSYCRQFITDPYLINCIKAQRVIYTVFPHRTRLAAMGVALCETGNTFDRWATNPSSRTAGLFQVHPGNHGTTWHWQGHGSITIDRHRLYNSWYNARVAVYMSNGGTSWRQWAGVCQP